MELQATLDGKVEKIDTPEKIERQEIFCHSCNQYVQFNIDLSMNGNHVLNCPSCGHEHCRVVKDGIISDTRWDSRNGTPPPNGLPVIPVTGNISCTSTSTYAIYGGQQGGQGSTSTIVITAQGTYSANIWLYSAWMNTGSSTAT